MQNIRLPLVKSDNPVNLPIANKANNKVLNPIEISNLTPDNANTTSNLPNVTRNKINDGDSHFASNIENKVNRLIIQIFILLRELVKIMEKLVIKNKIKDKVKDLSNEEIGEFVNAMCENGIAPKNDKELNELIDSLINSEYLFDDREFDELEDIEELYDTELQGVLSEEGKKIFEENTEIPDFLKARKSTQEK